LANSGEMTPPCGDPLSGKGGIAPHGEFRRKSEDESRFGDLVPRSGNGLLTAKGIFPDIGVD
jgi:hypothetical protein